MLSADIEKVDLFLSMSQYGENVAPSWQRIKAALAESTNSSHNTQIMPVCPKCGSGVTVFQSDIVHRCNNDTCQWAGKPA